MRARKLRSAATIVQYNGIYALRDHCHIRGPPSQAVQTVNLMNLIEGIYTHRSIMTTFQQLGLSRFQKTATSRSEGLTNDAPERHNF